MSTRLALFALRRTVPTITVSITCRHAVRVLIPLLIPVVGLVGATPSGAAQSGGSPTGSAMDVRRQPPDTAAFMDATARSLLLKAREEWWKMDRQIQSYEAVVKERMAVALRTPLKDRTLYRAEAAARVYWSADDETVVQVLASREEHPGGVADPENVAGIVEEVFDPASDRIYFGLTDQADDDLWIEHPVAPGSEAHYRFRSGDTLTLSLPDGRRLRAVQVEVIPREASFHLLSGSLWIEPESGALVRAVYRLARTVDILRDLNAMDEDDDVDRIPGLFLPMEFEMSMAVVEYALWNFEHWLPRRLRVEGVARAGILRAPASMEISYRILDVEGPDDGKVAWPDRTAAEVAERWVGEGRYGSYERDAGVRTNDGVRIYTLVPSDPSRLHTSEHLPPPIWEDAPGFTTEAALEGLYEELAETPAPRAARLDPELHWGFQRPGLVRFNRVEGFSVGARGRVAVGSPFGPLDVSATARFALPDARPSGRVVVDRESVGHGLEVAAFHGVAEVDPRARNLGLGNSATALFFGRDDGDYYRRTGSSVTLRPPAFRRETYRITLSAQRHEPVSADRDFTLSRYLGGADRPFRPNIPAREGSEYSAVLTVRPRWGSGARGAQGGVDLLLQGATGTFEYARSRAAARTALPLFAGLRLGLEAAGGTSWGDVPIQRQWFLGGTRTLRGYGGAAAVGPTFLRGRVELARQYGPAAVTVFSDAGWAGERNAVEPDDALVSAGVGASVLDGLVRVDVARALRDPRGWRLELYLDALL